MGEVLVVTLGLAVLLLVLGAEVSAARLAAFQRIAAHQHSELEEVFDATGLLEGLVDALGVAGDAQVGLELVVQRRQLGERLLEPRFGSLHAAVVPDDLAELTMEVVG